MFDVELSTAIAIFVNSQTKFTQTQLHTQVGVHKIIMIHENCKFHTNSRITHFNSK